MMKKNILSRLLKTAPEEQELLKAISCLSTTELQAERNYQNYLIEESTKDIDFYTQSNKFFGKLKAEYIFKDSAMRKQVDGIIAFHQAKVTEAENEIRFCKRIIKRIDTPIFTPDGRRV